MAAEDWIDFEAYDFEEDEDEIISFDSIECVTKKAVLFRNKNGLFWLPKSVIKINKKESYVAIPMWCDWKYFDDKPPERPK